MSNLTDKIKLYEAGLYRPQTHEEGDEIVLTVRIHWQTITLRFNQKGERVA